MREFITALRNADLRMKLENILSGAELNVEKFQALYQNDTLSITSDEFHKCNERILKKCHLICPPFPLKQQN